MGAPIARVEIGRYDYEVVGEFKFFKPGPDGKSYRPSVLIRLTDSDGVVGWGQSVPIPTWTYETPETVVSTLKGYLGPALIGMDPGDFAGIHGRMNEVIRPAFSVGQPLCKAGIDLACYDLAGKQRGQSVSDLLGGSDATSMVISWTSASPDIENARAQLEDGWARGFRNFNIKVGAPQTPEYDLELARMVRAFAPDAFLWADANTGYDTETALSMLPRLADAGVDVLESPLPPHAIRGYQALKQNGALPILMDEGILSVSEVDEFIALGMMDGIALKPARNAGIFPSWKIVQRLQDEGMMILGSGLTDPDLALAAALHVYGCAGIDRPLALNGRQLLDGWLTGDSLSLSGERLTVPTEPGLGVPIDETHVELDTVATS